MTDSIRSRLDHAPVPLKFGTSGRRGPVIHLTQLEVYINALAELEHLQSLPASDGGIRRGDEFFYGLDLRPSSSHYVAAEGGRGELAQAIERAIRDAGMKPVNVGCVPTPALTWHALRQNRGSIMVTGSHIPFNLNGYKTNRANGELRKTDEAPIHRLVEQVRERIYNQAAADSPFDEAGRFKGGHAELSPCTNAAREGYVRRYLDFFPAAGLRGKRYLVYQHSAVGRDLLVDLLRGLGAEAVPAGRSETFVPIDTENIDAAQFANIEALAHDAWQKHGAIDAVVSTDGDSDRPLILGVDPVRIAGGEAAGCRVRFFGGDLVGMIVAERLGTDAAVVPITCNDAIDRGPIKDLLEPKTRIGSPHVIAGIEAARAKGRRVICGWEPNGGFLLGSDVVRDGRELAALPTRDAMLPILEVLAAAAREGASVAQLFDRLPKRFSRSALLTNFPRAIGRRVIEKFSVTSGQITDAGFGPRGVSFRDASGVEIASADARTAAKISAQLNEFFTPALGFGAVTRINCLDGVRVYFDNGDIAHVRPSGNADELRIYAVADTQARADYIAAAGISEPDGILRRLAKSVAAAA